MIYHVLPEVEPFSERYGGALSRWAANVLRGDDNSTIVCPWADESWGFPAQRVWSISGLRHYVWSSRILRAGSMVALRVNLLRFLFAPLFKKLQPADTVYIHNRPEFALGLGPKCHRKGARIVLHMHNSHLLDWFPVPKSSLKVDALVFCSAFLKMEASEYAGRVLTSVIPNGADDSIFYPDQRSGGNDNPVPVILFASRLVREKGPHIFLEAMRLLKDRMIQVKGIMVGSSNFGGSKPTKFVNELLRMAPSNVQIHGYCSGKALADKFRKADVFCLPSTFNDPFPLAILEAMASRLPVVATQSGGIPEALAEGGGLLVQRGSSSDLAAALERLVTESSLREKMAEDGYASFRKNFTWPAVRQHYLRMLGSLSV